MVWLSFHLKREADFHTNRARMGERHLLKKRAQSRSIHALLSDPWGLPHILGISCLGKMELEVCVPAMTDLAGKAVQCASGTQPQAFASWPHELHGIFCFVSLPVCVPLVIILPPLFPGF